MLRTVTFKGSQGAEDLFVCKETGMVYLRQPCDRERVRWCTTTKWSGGYEANGPMKAGLTFHIVDDTGALLHEEVLVKDFFYGGTVATKVAPFSYEVARNFAQEVQKARSLASYDEWKAWLMAEAVAERFTGYADNWLYDSTSSELQQLEKVNVLGCQELILTSRQCVHRICGKVWTCFDLHSKDLACCMAICGYELNEN